MSRGAGNAPIFFSHMKGERLEDNFLLPYERSCAGYTHRGPYVLAIHVAAASVAAEGITSENLRRICAFDAAEVSETNVGQLNAMTVSSFSGPNGLIWGYHLARASAANDPLFLLHQPERPVPVYSADPLLRATRSLFGTVHHPRFPIFPGSHTPVALKDVYHTGPGWVYAVAAIGIVEEGNDRANILMEDVGAGVGNTPDERDLMKQCARSTQVVARQQGSRLKEVFVAVRSHAVQEGQTGCALTFLPYIHLAAAAVPGKDVERLKAMDLASWEAAVT